VELDRPPHLAQVVVTEPEIAGTLRRGRRVGDVTLEALVQIAGQPRVAPGLEVVVADVEQDLGGGVVVPRLAAQVELGPLRSEVVERLPALARSPRLLEVVGGAAVERELGERRGIRYRSLGSPTPMRLSA
jgi:hypothetical protein